MRHYVVRLGLVIVAVLAVAPSALAERGAYPHEFKQNNMGYCAPFLAQERLPNGDQVRPWINHLVQAATAGPSSFEGYENLGGFISVRAQSETDQTCLARS